MNIFILNTLSIGQDTIDFLSKEIKISGIIGLSKRDASDIISDYTYQKQYCETKKIPFIKVSDYSLKNESDKESLSKLDIDILIVTGWQRLVPEWLIKQCKICVIGSHGSPFGITGGRGRSPQNWALILGSKEFFISIFKIDAGIDSGEVIDTKKFDLSPHDTIKTSYYKVSMLTARMIAEAITSGKILENSFQEQDNEEAFYLPQRKPEDGEIDWNRSSLEIFNFIKALTKPYPGAYTQLINKKVVIWSGIPFSISEESKDIEPGTIVKIYNKNDLLVKTKDSYFLVEDYSSDVIPSAGDKFSSADFNNQMDEIIERHQSKYPDLKIAPSILNAAQRKQKFKDC